MPSQFFKLSSGLVTCFGFLLHPRHQLLNSRVLIAHRPQRCPQRCPHRYPRRCPVILWTFYQIGDSQWISSFQASSFELSRGWVILLDLLCSSPSTMPTTMPSTMPSDIFGLPSGLVTCRGFRIIHRHQRLRSRFSIGHPPLRCPQRCLLNLVVFRGDWGPDVAFVSTIVVISSGHNP